MVSFPRSSLTKLALILLVVILILGTLNYFGLFSPKKASKIIQPSPTISPVPDLQTKAKDLIVSLLPTILPSASIPSSSDITITYQENTSKENLFVSLQSKKVSGGGSITIDPDGRSITSLYLSFSQPYTASLTTKLAQTTTSSFFEVTPKGSWKCKPIENETYCENFWEETGTKKGVSMLGPVLLETGEKISVLAYCQHTKDSTFFSWKSCIVNFAKTGVQ